MEVATGFIDAFYGFLHFPQYCSIIRWFQSAKALRHDVLQRPSKQRWKHLSPEAGMSVAVWLLDPLFSVCPPTLTIRPYSLLRLIQFRGEYCNVTLTYHQANLVPTQGLRIPFSNMNKATWLVTNRESGWGQSSDWRTKDGRLYHRPSQRPHGRQRL